jgi:hypothetical protein
MASRVHCQTARSAIDKSVDEPPAGWLHWNRPLSGVVRSVKEENRWMGECGSGKGWHGPS